LRFGANGAPYEEIGVFPRLAAASSIHHMMTEALPAPPEVAMAWDEGRKCWREG
jgi:hypothetical protein